MQNPESLSNTKEPLTSGFASGFPESISGKRLSAASGISGCFAATPFRASDAFPRRMLKHPAGLRDRLKPV
jgi:hypothetical protein